MRHVLNTSFAAVLCLALSFGASPAQANPLEPVAGARSLAMGGAHRGMGTSNDALVLNPAGMALVRRYSIDTIISGRGDHVWRAMASAVDSKTSPVAAGVAYTREWGNPSDYDIKLNRIIVGMAYAPLPAISFGLSGQSVRGDVSLNHERHPTNGFNGSAGVMVHLGNFAGLGVTYDNFVHNAENGLTPPAFAFGASIRTGLLSVVGDMRIDRRDSILHTKTFGGGGELLLGQAFAARGGWRLGYASGHVDGPLNQYVTAGTAFVVGTGGIEAAFEKSLTGPGWTWMTALQFSM